MKLVTLIFCILMSTYIISTLIENLPDLTDRIYMENVDAVLKCDHLCKKRDHFGDIIEYKCYSIYKINDTKCSDEQDENHNIFIECTSEILNTELYYDPEYIDYGLSNTYENICSNRFHERDDLFMDEKGIYRKSYSPTNVGIILLWSVLFFLIAIGIIMIVLTIIFLSSK